MVQGIPADLLTKSQQEGKRNMLATLWRDQDHYMHRMQANHTITTFKWTLLDRDPLHNVPNRHPLRLHNPIGIPQLTPIVGYFFQHKIYVKRYHGRRRIKILSTGHCCVEIILFTCLEKPNIMLLKMFPLALMKTCFAAVSCITSSTFAVASMIEI
ncbi:hypothetical protein Ddc_05696 [Ditylenchus destructor]|nr:hypothetical protein Ddc_05696 [Ditylenchus destructor]